MSQLPTEALSYEVVVAEYFLGLRGAGLMLSPLDLELVREWERRGVPVAVVCRGLRHGLEQVRARSPGAAPPRAVRAYRLAVEDEWRAYRAGRVGEALAPPAEPEAARARLEAARALLAAAPRGGRGPPPEAYAAAATLLDAPLPAPRLLDVDRLLAEADAVLLRGWLAALGAPDRAALGRRCAERSGPRPPWTRPSEHRATLRAHLLDAAREAGLLCLRGSV